MSVFRVSVPASSANLGSGFDAVAVAFELRMSARVRVLDRGATSRWSYGGPHAPTHDGLRAAIECAVILIAPDAPALDVELENAIPLGAGLGSSAAAYALGVAIGAQLLATPPDDDALALAVAQLDGHPDNALAAWYGGTVVASLDGHRLTSARFAPLPVDAVVVTPDVALATDDARAMLPEQYARADVVFNLQRAALLGAALASGRLDLLREAMRDRLHQPYRAAAVPGLEEILDLDDPSLVAAALSGAGPSVLALADGDAVRIGERIAGVFERHGVQCTVRQPALTARGVLVTLG